MVMPSGPDAPVGSMAKASPGNSNARAGAPALNTSKQATAQIKASGRIFRFLVFIVTSPVQFQSTTRASLSAACVKAIVSKVITAARADYSSWSALRIGAGSSAEGLDGCV